MSRCLTKLVVLGLLTVAAPAVAQDASQAKDTKQGPVNALGQLKAEPMGSFAGERIWNAVELDGGNKVFRLRTNSANAAVRKAFQERFDAHKAALETCADGELLERSERALLSITLTTKKDGSIATTKVVKNELGEEVEKCVRTLVAPINVGKSARPEKVAVIAEWVPNYQPPKNALGVIGKGGTGMVTKRKAFGRTNGKSQKKTSRPKVTPGEWSIEGGLDEKLARRVIRRHRRATIYCYEKRLQANPKLAGKLTIELTVEKSGRVGETKIADSSLDDAEVDDCIQRVHKRLRFPRPDDGEAKISYELTFSPR